MYVFSLLYHRCCCCLLDEYKDSLCLGFPGPGSTIRMKTNWARTRKTLGPEATEITVTGPRNEKKIAYVPPTNQIVDSRSSSSSSSSSSESDDE